MGKFLVNGHAVTLAAANAQKPEPPPPTPPVVASPAPGRAVAKPSKDAPVEFPVDEEGNGFTFPAGTSFGAAVKTLNQPRAEAPPEPTTFGEATAALQPKVVVPDLLTVAKTPAHPMVGRPSPKAIDSEAFGRGVEAARDAEFDPTSQRTFGFQDVRAAEGPGRIIADTIEDTAAGLLDAQQADEQKAFGVGPVTAAKALAADEWARSPIGQAYRTWDGPEKPAGVSDTTNRDLAQVPAATAALGMQGVSGAAHGFGMAEGEFASAAEDRVKARAGMPYPDVPTSPEQAAEWAAEDARGRHDASINRKAEADAWRRDERDAVLNRQSQAAFTLASQTFGEGAELALKQNPELQDVAAASTDDRVKAKAEAFLRDQGLVALIGLYGNGGTQKDSNKFISDRARQLMNTWRDRNPDSTIDADTLSKAAHHRALEEMAYAKTTGAWAGEAFLPMTPEASVWAPSVKVLGASKKGDIVTGGRSFHGWVLDELGQKGADALVASGLPDLGARILGKQDDAPDIGGLGGMIAKGMGLQETTGPTFRRTMLEHKSGTDVAAQAMPSKTLGDGVLGSLANTAIVGSGAAIDIFAPGPIEMVGGLLHGLASAGRKAGYIGDAAETTKLIEKVEVARNAAAREAATTMEEGGYTLGQTPAEVLVAAKTNPAAAVVVLDAERHAVAAQDRAATRYSPKLTQELATRQAAEFLNQLSPEARRVVDLATEGEPDIGGGRATSPHDTVASTLDRLAERVRRGDLPEATPAMVHDIAESARQAREIVHDQVRAELGPSDAPTIPTPAAAVLPSATALDVLSRVMGNHTVAHDAAEFARLRDRVAELQNRGAGTGARRLLSPKSLAADARAAQADLTHLRSRYLDARNEVRNAVTSGDLTLTAAQKENLAQHLEHMSGRKVRRDWIPEGKPLTVEDTQRIDTFLDATAKMQPSTRAALTRLVRPDAILKRVAEHVRPIVIRDIAVGKGIVTAAEKTASLARGLMFGGNPMADLDRVGILAATRDLKNATTRVLDAVLADVIQLPDDQLLPYLHGRNNLGGKSAPLTSGWDHYQQFRQALVLQLVSETGRRGLATAFLTDERLAKLKGNAVAMTDLDHSLTGIILASDTPEAFMAALEQKARSITPGGEIHPGGLRRAVAVVATEGCYIPLMEHYIGAGAVLLPSQREALLAEATATIGPSRSIRALHAEGRKMDRTRGELEAHVLAAHASLADAEREFTRLLAEEGDARAMSDLATEAAETERNLPERTRVARAARIQEIHDRIDSGDLPNLKHAHVDAHIALLDRLVAGYVREGLIDDPVEYWEGAVHRVERSSTAERTALDTAGERLAGVVAGGSATTLTGYKATNTFLESLGRAVAEHERRAIPGNPADQVALVPEAMRNHVHEQVKRIRTDLKDLPGESRAAARKQALLDVLADVYRKTVDKVDRNAERPAGASGEAVAPAPVQPRPLTPGASAGDATTTARGTPRVVTDAQGTATPVRLKLVPVDGPLTSHIDGSNDWTPGYTRELQNRPDAAVRDDRVQAGSMNLDPDRYLYPESQSLTDGPPIVWKDATGKDQVIAGNGRTWMIRRALARDDAAAARYRAHVDAVAESLGLERPAGYTGDLMLVREADIPATDLPAAIVLANNSQSSHAAAMAKIDEVISRTVSARAAMGGELRLDPARLPLEMTADAARQMLDDNPNTLGEALRAMYPDPAARGALDGDALKLAVQSALLMALDNATLARVREAGGPTAERVMNAMPAIMKLHTIASEKPSWAVLDVGPVMSDALDLLESARANGKSGSAKAIAEHALDLANQAPLPGHRAVPVSAVSTALAIALNAGGERPELALSRRMNAAVGDAEALNQMGMFGPKREPLDAILDNLAGNAGDIVRRLPDHDAARTAAQGMESGTGRLFQKTERKPRAVTLFSGGGLVEEGLRGLIHPTLAVESNTDIAAHYRTVHGDHVQAVPVQDADYSSAKDADYMHASPVCKNFSGAKAADLAGEQPLDIETAKATVRALGEVKPRVFTLENVPRYADSEAMTLITDALTQQGYAWDTAVYDSADYGAPTYRKRLLLRAVKDGPLPPMPVPTGRTGDWFATVADIVDDLPDTEVAPWMRERLEKAGIDPAHPAKPTIVMGGSVGKNILHVEAGGPAPTLKAGNEKHVILMPDGRAKKVTARAQARITGLPDSYPLPAERLATTIIGNGVPPALSRAVFGPLLEGISGEPSIRRLFQKKNLLVQHNLSADNLLHADKLGGLVAPSLGVGRIEHPYTGFGEITLIGPPELADPKAAGVRWFDADVYSRRWPSQAHKVSGKKADAWNAKNLVPYRERTGERYINSLTEAAEATSKGEGWGQPWTNLKRSGAMQLKYVEEVLGQKFDVPTKFDLNARTAFLSDTPAMREFAASLTPEQKKHIAQYDEVPPEVTAQADAAVRLAANQARDALIAGGADPKGADDLRFMTMQDLDLVEGTRRKGVTDVPVSGRVVGTILRDVRRIEEGRKPDGTKARYALRDIIEKSEGGDAAYIRWYDQQLDQVREGAIFTPEGRSRPIPYTAENVLADLVKGVRGGENFNYGLGNSRSKGAKEYRTRGGIEADRERIVHPDAMKAHKTALDEKFQALIKSLSPYYEGTSGLTEEVATVIGESYAKGASAPLRQMFKGVPREVVAEVAKFAQDLRESPTEYMEGKPQRILPFKEFKAAVVPEDVRPEVLDALKRHGVDDVVTYKRGDDADRARAIREASERNDLLFQNQEKDGLTKGYIDLPTDARGRALAISRDAQAIITLTQHADLSTLTHEHAHFIRRIAKPGSMREVDAYVDEHFGGWQSTEAEEWFARQAESYFTTGDIEPKAAADMPARALAAFKDVLATVQRVLRAIYKGGGLPDLTPEAKAFFDRIVGVEEPRPASKGVPQPGRPAAPTPTAIAESTPAPDAPVVPSGLPAIAPLPGQSGRPPAAFDLLPGAAGEQQRRRFLSDAKNGLARSSAATGEPMWAGAYARPTKPTPVLATERPAELRRWLDREHNNVESYLQGPDAADFADYAKLPHEMNRAPEKEWAGRRHEAHATGLQPEPGEVVPVEGAAQRVALYGRYAKRRAARPEWPVARGTNEYMRWLLTDSGRLAKDEPPIKRDRVRVFDTVVSTMPEKDPAWGGGAFGQVVGFKDTPEGVRILVQPMASMEAIFLRDAKGNALLDDEGKAMYIPGPPRRLPVGPPILVLPERVHFHERGRAYRNDAALYERELYDSGKTHRKHFRPEVAPRVPQRVLRDMGARWEAARQVAIHNPTPENLAALKQVGRELVADLIPRPMTAAEWTDQVAIEKTLAGKHFGQLGYGDDSDILFTNLAPPLTPSIHDVIAPDPGEPTMQRQVAKPVGRDGATAADVVRDTYESVADQQGFRPAGLVAEPLAPAPAEMPPEVKPTPAPISDYADDRTDAGGRPVVDTPTLATPGTVSPSPKIAAAAAAEAFYKASVSARKAQQRALDSAREALAGATAARDAGPSPRPPTRHGTGADFGSTAQFRAKFGATPVESIGRNRVPLSPEEIALDQTRTNGARLMDALITDPADRARLNAIRQMMDNGGYIPASVRDAMGQRITEILDRMPIDDRAALGGSILSFWKRSITRGAWMTKPSYHLNNMVGDFDQIAAVAGFKVAIETAIRSDLQNIMAVPIAGQALSGLGVSERIRRVIQQGGEAGLGAVDALLQRSGQRLEVNGVLDGRLDTVMLNGRLHRMRDLRDTAVRGGVFDGFDVSELCDSLEQAGSDKWTGFKQAMPTATVQDIAEGIGTRKRVGLYLTLIENGYTPEAAAKGVVDSLYDYKYSMTRADKHIVVKFLFPFWAWQKNANLQVMRAMLTPGGAYRIRVMAQAQKQVGNLITNYLDDRDPYGVRAGLMPPDVALAYQQALVALRSPRTYGGTTHRGLTAPEIAALLASRDTYDRNSPFCWERWSELYHVALPPQMEEVFPYVQGDVLDEVAPAFYRERPQIRFRLPVGGTGTDYASYVALYAPPSTSDGALAWAGMYAGWGASMATGAIDSIPAIDSLGRASAVKAGVDPDLYAQLRRQSAAPMVQAVGALNEGINPDRAPLVGLALQSFRGERPYMPASGLVRKIDPLGWTTVTGGSAADLPSQADARGQFISPFTYAAFQTSQIAELDRIATVYETLQRGISTDDKQRAALAVLQAAIGLNVREVSPTSAMQSDAYEAAERLKLLPQSKKAVGDTPIFHAAEE